MTVSVLEWESYTNKAVASSVLVNRGLEEYKEIRAVYVTIPKSQNETFRIFYGAYRI